MGISKRVLQSKTTEPDFLSVSTQRALPNSATANRYSPRSRFPREEGCRECPAHSSWSATLALALAALLLSACTDPSGPGAALGLGQTAQGISGPFVFSDEYEISAPVYGVNPREFYSANIGVNANGQYLVAYADRRGDDSGWATGDNLRLTRVAKDGTLLDLGGIEMEISGPSRKHGFVASDGIDYLVAWIEMTDYEESKILFARIAEDGKILQVPTELRAEADVKHYAPDVCFDGVHFNVVFGTSNSQTGNTKHYAARITKGGAIVSATALPSTVGKYAYSPKLACNAQVSLIAWGEHDAGGAEMRVVAWPTQQPLPTSSSALSLPGVNQVGALTLVEGAGNFLAVWEEERSQGTGFEMVGQFLTTSGARTKAGDLLLASLQTTSRFPQLRFDGQAFRMLTQELVANQEQVFLTTLDQNGAITSSTSALTSGDRHYATGLACQNGACLVSSTTGDPFKYVAEGTRVDANNQAVDNPAFSLSTPSDEQPLLSMTNDGNQILSVWLTATGRDPSRLFIRRQDQLGGWLDSAPVALHPGEDAQRAPLYSTAIPSGGFALAYALTDTQGGNTTRALHVSYVSATGQVTSPAPFSFGAYEDIQGISCTTTECLVFVYDYFKTYAYRLDHQGKPQTASRTVFTCEGNLSAVGDEYWCVAPSTGGTSGQGVERFDTTLVSLGTPLQIPVPNENVGGAVVAADATGVTLAWSTASTAGVTLKAARVDLTASAVLAGPAELVSFKSTRFTQGELSPLAILPVGAKTYFLWLAADGQLIRKLRIQELSPSLALVGALTEVDPGALDFRYLQAAGTSAGHLVLGYVKRDSDPARGSHRIKFRHSAIVSTPDAGVASPDPKVTVDAAVAKDARVPHDAGLPLPDSALTPPDVSPPADLKSHPVDVSPLTQDSETQPADIEQQATDAGVPLPEEVQEGGGCSCRLSPAGQTEFGHSLFLLLLGCVLLRRKQRPE